LFVLEKPLDEKRPRTSLPVSETQDVIQEEVPLNVIAAAVQVEQKEKLDEIDKVNP